MELQSPHGGTPKSSLFGSVLEFVQSWKMATCSLAWAGSRCASSCDAKRRRGSMEASYRREGKSGVGLEHWPQGDSGRLSLNPGLNSVLVAVIKS